MSRTIILLLVALFFGLIIGMNIKATPSAKFDMSESFPSSISGSQAVDTHHEALAERIATLEKLLQVEISKRESLANQIALIPKQLNNQAGTIINPEMEKGEDPTVTSGVTNTAQTIAQSTTRTAKEVLASLGIDESVADTIKKREEERELEQLYLRNQATREGWVGTERYFEQAQKLTNKSDLYREELGDNNYDQYLYESGQFNRVSVKNVIAGSPAANIGIESGDIIYSYNNARLFSWMELTSLTSQGTAGELVSMEIHRGEQVIDMYIARGPLGVRLIGTKINPS